MSDLFSGLANLTKQVTSNISTYEVRKITDKIQGYVMNYTEAENLVREATNEDPWGPTGPQMKEISNLTFQYDGFHQVTEMLWKRMFEDNKYAWRRVYKSLTLLNYLLQHGSERVLANSRDHVFQLRSLEHYKHVDEKGKDQGVNIRHRVGIIIELLSDDDKLRAERKKAKADNKERYQGYTSNDIKMGRGGGYNGNSASSFSSNTGSSKRYDDFDSDWKSEKKDDYNSKEVNAFQFPEDARQSSNSPELGFRQDEAEDDGFGSFAAARSHTTPSPNPTSEFADFSSPAAKSTHVPSLAPPSATMKHVPAPRASFDLLGLDSAPAQTIPAAPSDPFGGASSSQHVDFFSAAPVTTNTAAARPPRPPSGGGLIDSASAQPPSGFNVDWNSAPGAISTATSDPFGDFANVTPVKPAAAPKTDNLCDLNFGGFTTPVTAPTQTSSNLDFFGSIPAAARVQPQSSGLEDLFSNSMMLTPSAPVPAAQQVSPSPSSNENKAQAKIGNTWAGASGLFDLDNLAGKSGPAKPSLSLNQMQQQKQGGTNGNMW